VKRDGARADHHRWIQTTCCASAVAISLDATSGYNRFQPEITILAPTSHSFAYFEEAEPDLDVERWKRLSEAIQHRRKKGVLCSGAPGVR
jgi:hypothetical protein